MDNRIANDMISSGMIPSGEKKKEDLSRTQYGSAPSPSKLMDAYKSMYEHHQKDKDGNTIPHEGEELNEALPLIPALGKVAMIAAKKGVAGMAAKGAGKAGLKATAMAFKNPTAGNIGKVAGQALKGAAKDPLVQQQVVGGAVNKMNEPKEKVNKSGMVTAGADLFDIIKGQLLDEGLSEEEIKDIMLTLTPDEIMSEMAVNPNIAAMDAKNKADMIARAQAKKVPENVKAASRRQYTAGGPKDKGDNKYTTQDKKTIIDYNKNKESM